MGKNVSIHPGESFERVISRGNRWGDGTLSRSARLNTALARYEYVLDRAAAELQALSDAEMSLIATVCAGIIFDTPASEASLAGNIVSACDELGLDATLGLDAQDVAGKVQALSPAARMLLIERAEGAASGG